MVPAQTKKKHRQQRRARLLRRRRRQRSWPGARKLLLCIGLRVQQEEMHTQSRDSSQNQRSLPPAFISIAEIYDVVESVGFVCACLQGNVPVHMVGVSKTSYPRLFDVEDWSGISLGMLFLFCVSNPVHNLKNEVKCKEVMKLEKLQQKLIFIFKFLKP